MTIALTKTRLLMGIKYEKTIEVKAFGNAAVKVRPIADSGLADIEVKLGYGLFDAIKDFGNMGMDEAELEALTENEASPESLKKLASLDLPPKLFQYMIALCEKGIVPTPDPECPACHGIRQPNGAICPECDIRTFVKEALIGFSSLEIGAVILGMSMSNWEEIEDFFKAQKVASGPASLPSQA